MSLENGVVLLHCNSDSVPLVISALTTLVLRGWCAGCLITNQMKSVSEALMMLWHVAMLQG